MRNETHTGRAAVHAKARAAGSAAGRSAGRAAAALALAALVALACALTAACAAKVQADAAFYDAIQSENNYKNDLGSPEVAEYVKQSAERPQQALSQPSHSEYGVTVDVTGGAEGQAAPYAAISKASLSGTVDESMASGEGRFDMTLDVSYDGQRLAGVEFYADAGGLLAARSPELHPAFITANVSDLAAILGPLTGDEVTAEQIQKIVEGYASYFTGVLRLATEGWEFPNDEDFWMVARPYLAKMKETVPTEKYAVTNKAAVDGVPGSFTAVSLSLTGQELKSLVQELARYAASDDELVGYVGRWYAPVQGAAQGYFEALGGIMDSEIAFPPADEFKEQFRQALQQAEGAVAASSDDEFPDVEACLYLNGKSLQCASLRFPDIESSDCTVWVKNYEDASTKAQVSAVSLEVREASAGGEAGAGAAGGAGDPEVSVVLTNTFDASKDGGTDALVVEAKGSALADELGISGGAALSVTLSRPGGAYQSAFDLSLGGASILRVDSSETWEGEAKASTRVAFEFDASAAANVSPLLSAGLSYVPNVAVWVSVDTEFGSADFPDVAADASKVQITPSSGTDGTLEQIAAELQQNASALMMAHMDVFGTLLG
jgi:hypothetical protein